jgi:hypothetical protein
MKKNDGPLGGALVQRRAQKLFRLMSFAILGLLPGTLLAQQTLRVNCGGPNFTDSKGQVWQADEGFTGGIAYTVASFPIAGTPDPLLYQHFRLNPTSYSLAVPNGQYHVNLLFAEDNPNGESVGARIFTVSLQGANVFTNLDIFAEAGTDKALVKSANVNVTNGKIAIGFIHVAGLNPKISAIEILPGSAPPSLTLNFKYPDGTPVSGNLNYAITSSLLNLQGAAALFNGQAQCVLFANPSSLGISAQFNVNLNLTDTTGHQLWQINLGMNPSGVNLGAVQSSALNVVVQKQ